VAEQPGVCGADADDEDGEAVAAAADGDAAGEPVPEVEGVTAGELAGLAAPLPLLLAEGTRDAVALWL
jgi:hypothetical protein